VSGYSDSLTCVLRANTHAEVDYYRYASPDRTRSAFSAASAWRLPGTAGRPAGCLIGPGNSGRWSAGGATIGNIACSGRPGGGAVLIWDDPRTGIVAVASSPVLIPAVLSAFWTANGASIDGSVHEAQP
jgi:hypothetical protein